MDGLARCGSEGCVLVVDAAPIKVALTQLLSRDGHTVLTAGVSKRERL
jgi:hypothetical protein